MRMAHRNKRGYIYENGRLQHRTVMEAFLGRKLEPGEEVHHKDHNPSNNLLENLVLTTRREHKAAFHTGLSWSKHGHVVCVVCGKNDNPHRSKGKCRRCYQKTNVQHWGTGNVPTNCACCGRTAYKHRAHGLCNVCYMRQYRTKQADSS